jgi:hypothetical protein
MESRNIIILLSIILIILAVGLVLEVFVLNNGNSEPAAIVNNTTTSNVTAEPISTEEESSSDDTNSIEANRPKNDPRYKGYTPYHESEVTKDGWNPAEHETYRERMPDGSVKIHYDDNYFRLVDENGYVITYGYG